MTPKLESEVERPFKDWVAKHYPDVFILKTHERNWPDDVIFFPGGHCFFIEFKAPGKDQRRAQKSASMQLKKQGHIVHTFDNLEHAKQTFVFYAIEHDIFPVNA